MVIIKRLIIKKVSKMQKFVEVYFVRTVFFKVLVTGTVLVSFMISSHNYWIINNTSYIFTIIYNIIFLQKIFLGVLQSHHHLLLLHFWLEFYFLLSKLHLHLHMFCSCFWFVYSCYHIKSMQVYILFHLEHIIY